MKKVILSALVFASVVVLYSCGGNPVPVESAQTNTETAGDVDSKGIGPIKEVMLTNPLDQEMVKNGKAVYDLKCSACHHLDNTKLVGPGWKDVTSRHKPEWIMNFAINADEMLNKDPAAMTLLEECLVRMPNQNLVESDARNVYEFMRNNDGVK